VRLEGLYAEKSNLGMLLSPFVEIDLDFSISQKTMNASEVKSLMFQLLQAVAYMHKQDLVHRNIKPTSILRFEDYTLKLCSFSYARSVHNNQPIDMIVPKPTLWHYAPEVFLSQKSGSVQKPIDWKAVDMWAVGCVFAEMLLQKPLFAAAGGGAGPDMLQNILSVLDCRPKDLSSVEGLSLFPNTQSQPLLTVLSKSPYYSHPSFRSATSLLREFLVFDAPHRCTAAKALQHEYFSDLRSPQEETITKGKDISKEVLDSCIPEFIDFYCSGLL